MNNAGSNWSHYNPVQVTAGVGVLEHLPGLIDVPGSWLLLTSEGFTRRGVTAHIRALAEADGTRKLRVHDAITPNPELIALESLAHSFADTSLVGIIALGGGSVLDAAKVLAVIVGESAKCPLQMALRDGIARAWTRTLSLVAIPTTSGTGAEVTPFATVWDESAQKKHSVTGDMLRPDRCLLDPMLTLSLPHDVTLYTGLDAASHALESLWNRNRTPVSEALALGALERIATALPQVLQRPENLAQRQEMQNASLMSGMAISQTRTAIAHAISYPLTLRFGVPHGLACSFTLQAILRRHLSDLADAGPKRLVLEGILGMLGRLDLHAHLRRYANDAQVMELLPAMTAPGRSENFLFHQNPEQTLNDSLG